MWKMRQRCSQPASSVKMAAVEYEKCASIRLTVLSTPSWVLSVHFWNALLSSTSTDSMGIGTRLWTLSRSGGLNPPRRSDISAEERNRTTYLLLGSARTLFRRGKPAGGTAHLWQREEVKSGHFTVTGLRGEERQTTDHRPLVADHQRTLRTTSGVRTTHLELDGGVLVTAPPQAGRREQAVDAVGHPDPEGQVPLDHTAFPLVDEQLPLHTRQRPVTTADETKGLIMVPRARNARGLRTPVLADPPCVRCKGLTCASQKW